MADFNLFITEDGIVAVALVFNSLFSIEMLFLCIFAVIGTFPIINLSLTNREN